MAQPLKDMFDPYKTPDLTREMIRDALTKLCSKQLDEYNPGEDPTGVTQALEKSGGIFAHNYIDKLDLDFQQRRFQMESEPDNKAYRIDKPFQELEGVLNDFYMNEDLCNEQTMITGEDMCKMFDICIFLA